MNYLREVLEFDKRFDDTFFSCDIGAAKPELAFFHQIEEQLGLPSQELLLVDDSPACVEAARAAGWKAFHYNGPNGRAALAKLCTTRD